MTWMYKIEGSVRPAIVRMYGKVYVASGSNWVEVPAETTLDQVEWIDSRPEYKPRSVEVVTREVASSKGNKTYYVTVQSDGKKDCTCAGFTYRRNCRHVNEVKAEKGW